MFKRNVTMLLGIFALLAAMSLTPAKGQVRSGETLDINRAMVNTELYLWNRFSDLLDTFRCGVAFGPGLGFEAAITDYVNLGAYANCERGLAFPHIIPPLWLVDYYEHNADAFQAHGGKYATVSFGPWRAEAGKEIIGTSDKHPFRDNSVIHFARDRWDIRLQLDLLLIHLYIAVRPVEIIDFFTGIVGYDFSLDDQKLDSLQERRPADQFGRGLSNVFFGFLEVPINILRVTRNEGDLAGATKGVGLGLWRFFVRECVGVIETIAFPFGWEPIIEPAYVFDNGEGDISWRVYKPAFHKRY
ncbi:MAG: exosortase system-associated protein, TIGR04073 family [Victivallales bacterium]|nr:exosortase system-associated protein, TIGR04073 family [Victivallales bacterium]